MNVFKEEFTVNSDAVKVSRNQKVFLFKETSAANENYTLRWADGFSGKV
jgi:GH43 family beta-xylosidase